MWFKKMSLRSWSKDNGISQTIFNTLNVLIFRLENVGEILVQFARLELAQPWKVKFLINYKQQHCFRIFLAKQFRTISIKYLKQCKNFQ